MLNKNAKISYNKIIALSCDFDRSFDNTVVDTFAFDKVLHSKTFSEFLYEKLDHASSLSEQNLNNIIHQSTDLAIKEVENIYMTTKHKVYMPDVYYNYVEQLVSRIVKVS